MIPSTKRCLVSTHSSAFAAITDAAKTGVSADHKVLAALLSLGFLVFTGCGGAYQNVRRPTGPPTEPPYEKSFTQVQVFAAPGPSIPIGGSVLVSASAVYQISPNSFTNTDVTNSAAWVTSNTAIATVNNGVVTGTGIGSVTISASYGGKTGSTTIFVGLTHYITISPAGPFRLSAGPEIDFYATETFSDGTTVDVSGPATWDTSPNGIISLYPYFGFGTLVAPGTTTITATLDSGESGSAQVTVVQ